MCNEFVVQYRKAMDILVSYLCLQFIISFYEGLEPPYVSAAVAVYEASNPSDRTSKAFHPKRYKGVFFPSNRVHDHYSFGRRERQRLREFHS